MVFRELARNGAPPRDPEENLQHALLLLARTEVRAVPAVLEASALPPQRVTLHLKGSLWCWDSCGFLCLLPLTRTPGAALDSWLMLKKASVGIPIKGPSRGYHSGSVQCGISESN